MTFLSFKKLFPAKKTWRMIRLKLQGKIQKSKVTKKPKRSTKSKKKLTWPNFCSFQLKKLKPKNSSRTLPTYKYYLKKTASPVYIDQLFMEPAAVSVVKATTVSSSIVALKGQKGTEANRDEGNSSSTCSAKKLMADYGEMQVNVVGKSRDEEGSHHSASAADDIWESMAESPHMDEINQRAEEFIASFRAEMQLQEMIARRL